MPHNRFSNYIFVVGAQKGGTTALHSFLVQHPSIVGGSRKELHFFNRENVYAKGLPYYVSHYPVFSRGKYALDSTPAYLYSTEAPERIHAFSPEAKIIILLREPISRAFSAFNMYKQLVGSKSFQFNLLNAERRSKSFFMPIAKGEIDPNIDYFLDRELAMIRDNVEGGEPALIRRGIYAMQIQRYLEFFGSTNVLILFSDSLREETKGTVNQAFSFLNLEPMSDLKL